MVRTPPAATDRLHAWFDRYHAETAAPCEDVDEACAALLRMVTTAPRGLSPPQRDAVCSALNGAWAHVLAAVTRACDAPPAILSAERPLAPPVPDCRAAHLLADIDRRFADPRLTLKAAARQLAVSPSHLTHVLKVATGRTFGAHLHARRVVEARRLLVATRLSVKEIASHVGYSTTTQLDRHFRKLAGCPPTVYRASERSTRTDAIARDQWTPRSTQSPTHPQK